MPNVSVEIRIKPSSRDILEFSNNKIIVGSKVFTFSRVHYKTKQKELFNLSVQPFLDKFLNGANCTILVYGQTGSGKTYTMGLSHEYEQGIIQNSLEMLFNGKKVRGETGGFCSQGDVSVNCSFIEIYNEEIYDLCNDMPQPRYIGKDDSNRNVESFGRIPLNIRQGQDEISIVGVREIPVASFEEAINLLKQGSENRTTKSTKMNSESSRSHAIFTISMNRKINDKTVESTLTFVDLAGSERLKRSECVGKAAKEAISINKGLLSLGNVISALYMKKNHIPFRDSKLTRILQKCLNGNALLIACVSGLQEDAFETTNTLKYASRAALISLYEKVSVGNDKDKLVILNLKKEISALKDENNKLRAMLLIKRGNNTGSSGGNVCSCGATVFNENRHSEVEDLKTNETKRCLNSSETVKNKIPPAFISSLPFTSLFRPTNFKSRDLKNKNFNDQRDISLEQNLQKISLFDKRRKNKTEIFMSASTDDSLGEAQILQETSESLKNAIINASTNKQNNFSDYNTRNDNPCEVIFNQDLINIEQPVNLKRKRLVSFDLEPKPKNHIFTPLKETQKAKFHLIDSISGYNAISMIKHNNRLFLNCIDSKIRFYDPNNSKSLDVAVSDDSIRCMCSTEADLFYTSRSLLKSLSPLGRTLPVFAYKNEISSLIIKNNTVITGHEDGALAFLDLRSNIIFYTEKIHKSAIFDTCVTEGGFYTCSRDHSVKFCDRKNLLICSTKESTDNCNTSVTYNSNLFENNSSPTTSPSHIKSDPAPPVFISLSPPHYDSVTNLLDFKGKCISTGRDASIKVWNKGIPFKTVPCAHESWIKSSVALENVFLTGCKNGILKGWNFIDHSIRCIGKVDLNSSVNCMTEYEGDVWVSCQNKKILRYSLE